MNLASNGARNSFGGHFTGNTSLNIQDLVHIKIQDEHSTDNVWVTSIAQIPWVKKFIIAPFVFMPYLFLGDKMEIEIPISINHRYPAN